MQPQVQTASVAGAGGFGDGGDDPGKSGEDILKVIRQMLLRGTKQWRQLSMRDIAKQDVIFVVEEPAADPAPAHEQPPAVQQPPASEPPGGDEQPADEADEPPADEPPPPMQPPPGMPPPGMRQPPDPPWQPSVVVLDAETDEWTGRHTEVQIYNVFYFVFERGSPCYLCVL